MILRTTALVLLALPLAFACGAESETEGAPEPMGATASEVTSAIGTSMQTTTRVNLRSGASTADAIVLTMPKGSTVTTLAAATKNGFFHVSYQGEDGWAHSTYLTRGASAAPNADDAPRRGPEAGRGVQRKDVLGRDDAVGGRLRLPRQVRPAVRRDVLVQWRAEPRLRRQRRVDRGPHVSFSTALCKKSARVCKGSKCITAQVMDRGATSSFEGSTPVLEALGVTPGAKGCASFGTATGVTVTLE